MNHSCVHIMCIESKLLTSKQVYTRNWQRSTRKYIMYIYQVKDHHWYTDKYTQMKTTTQTGMIIG